MEPLEDLTLYAWATEPIDDHWPALTLDELWPRLLHPRTLSDQIDEFNAEHEGIPVPPRPDARVLLYTDLLSAFDRALEVAGARVERLPQARWRDAGTSYGMVPDPCRFRVALWAARKLEKRGSMVIVCEVPHLLPTARDDADWVFWSGEIRIPAPRAMLVEAT